ncbi:P-loop containing nucleoside triphosphate hydrolase protein [Trichodelitschia bisporula]|uniref:P-loop containing nucleoside triphosphate hydrolase protein n=1 Tax=Trichodelitschia bisporula TaxID=703511 RepID=A0A6G1I975_9PEZI|nr:P-loop containing nucleoside triphosphate hydrolase protein [Trichodelitschia bisporula]
MTDPKDIVEVSKDVELSAEEKKWKKWYRTPFDYIRLLTSADPKPFDYGLLLTGLIAAAAAGVPFPLVAILFGQVIDDLNSSTCDNSAHALSAADAHAYQSDVNSKILLIVYLAIAQFACIYIHLTCWTLAGARLAQRLRERYLRSLLRQEVSFFDSMPAGEVSSRLNSEIQNIRNGTSEKVGLCISATSFFITAYVVAFIKDTILAAILISLVPAYFIMSFVGSHYIEKYSAAMSDHLASASAIASEALSHVPVVHAFSANARLEVKFAADLVLARKEGIKKAVATGVQCGFMYFIAYAANALAFWQGSKTIADAVRDDSNASVGKVYTVIFVLVDATLMLSQVAPFLQIFGVATGAFRKLREDMRHQSAYDGTCEVKGEFPDIQGNIEFREVSFAYPSRPDRTVLKGVSISFPSAKHTALVGLSGSGKSTIAGLTTRLYDPKSGTITIDGVDVRDINVRHLRSFISLVQQDPAFLDRSILENIALGLINSPAAEHVPLKPVLLSHELAAFVEDIRRHRTKDILAVAQARGPEITRIVMLVQEAASLADAASFIENLQFGYATSIGSSGNLLSGGQKQRVALARALVRDPRILILDEATASLDSQSELRIQEALERIAGGRTLISIAHRISTVRGADNIIVMRDGDVLEQGRHAELMARKGAYAELVALQGLDKAAPKNGEKDVEKAPKAITSKEMSTGSNLSVDLPSESDEKAVEERGEDDEEAPGVSSERSLLSIFKSIGPLIRRDILVVLIALLGAVVVGGAFSAESVIFGNTVGHLSPCNSESSIRSAGNFFGLMFFVLAIIEFFANFVSWSGFGFVSEKLLYTVRVLSFRALFEQDLQWHQSEDRTPSGLLSVITKDGNALGGLSGSIIGTILSILINMIVAVVLTHIVAWRIALVCLATVPLLLGTGLMELRILSAFEEKHETAYSKSVSIAVEAVNSIKTIAAFSLEHETLSSYRRQLAGPRKETTLVTLHASFWLAMTYFMGNLSYALAFWWGSKQIIEGRYTQTQFLIVVMSLLVSAQLWSQMFALAPELSSARAAVARILNLLDLGQSRTLHPPPDLGGRDIEKSAEAKPPPRAAGASVTFRDVGFAYPARPSVPVLHDLNLHIAPGQYAALVGPSGAGKSTVISLIERLYTPTAGVVEIDGRDIARLGVGFRDDLAYVPQDAALFDGSVRFNVALGARPGVEPSDAEIDEACRVANVHDVIAGLPEGYDTQVGPNGGQLSGGQKQRLAIARALVRKPRLLILDESTSALDAESEGLLQEGLERAVRGGGMTVVAIAHRLRTVRAADVIFVVEEGRCVDRGRHEELMERSETYRANAVLQMLDAGGV